MAGGGGGSLEDTAAFAAATVCFVMIFVSIIIEHVIELIGKWLKNTNRIKLYEALEKIKSELMLVGFISLLLTASQSNISKICIDEDVAKSWLPCKNGEIVNPDPPVCKKAGKVQFISQGALHELHVFIFVLACVHVINCVLTMVLGKAKMRRWRKWEEETKTEEYLSSHNPETPRYTRQVTFVRRHYNFWTTNPILLPIRCFFRQFLASIRKVDYLTLRHGFITAHIATENQGNFDFHNYMNRSLEEDYKVVVGISPTIWFTAVVSLLFNKYEYHHSLWIPVIPIIVLLAVGTKVQVIIAKMAFRIQERSDMVVGEPVVEIGDDLFWFNSPRFLLYLINFVIFQNAFQLSFYLYTWFKFGIDSCFHKQMEDKIIIVCMGLVVLILCSYVTLPLYALVTLMGSTMKRTRSSRSSESNHRSSSTVRPYPEHLDTADQRIDSIQYKSTSGHDKVVHEDNGTQKNGMVELAIQILSTEDVESKDSPFARRSKSCN